MEVKDCIRIGKVNGLNILIPKSTDISKTMKEINEKIKILHFGQTNDLPTKVMLLIGETGAGKTTMLTAIYNNFRGVNLEDDHRFKLFEEEEGCWGKKAYESQTESITAYLFYAQPFMKCKDFNIMVIDSPGLCDTRGTDKQKSIMEHMAEFLKEEKYGIDDLSCIGYVVKANVNREQEYFKESVQESLKFFGKDTGDITFILKTFAFNSDNCIRDMFRKWGIDIQNEFDFDNGVLLKPNKMGVENRQGKITTKKDMDATILIWNDMIESFEALFQRLSKVVPVSMRMTRKAMEEKIYLEENKKNLTLQALEIVKNLIAGRKNQEMLASFKRSMEENKDWEGEEVV